jgi:hypothetical protein
VPDRLLAFVHTFHTSLDVAQAASAGRKALASLPMEIGVGRVSVKHDVQAGTEDHSAGVNKVLSRTLYVVPMGYLTPAVVACEQDSEFETNGMRWDAPISVWWDQPPFSEDAQ